MILYFGIVLAANAAIYFFLKQEIQQKNKEIVSSFNNEIGSSIVTKLQQINGENIANILSTVNEFNNKLVNNTNNQLATVRNEIDTKIQAMTLMVHKQSQASREDMLKFEREFSTKLAQEFDKLRNTMDNRIKDLNDRVNENIEKSFEKANTSFNRVLESLGKIDAAQKNIQELSGNVISLEKVLTDKKSRGNFGEVQLKQILQATFGESNNKIYQLQYQIEGETVRPDAVIFYPKPVGMLCVDSKFPLENYQRMVDSRGVDASSYKDHTKNFVNDIKKHIKDIAGKYIIEGKTAAQAMMFIPSEAIFAEIVAYHQDAVIGFAHEHSVFIAGPTTLMAVLNTLQVSIKDIELSKNAEKIKQEIAKLSDEFGRYSNRWGKLYDKVNQLQKAADEVNITSGKISRKFQTIAGGKKFIADEENIGIKTITSNSETESDSLF